MTGIGAAAGGAASIPNSSTHQPSNPSSNAAAAAGIKTRPLPTSKPSQVNVHTDAGRYNVNNGDDNPANLHSDIPPTYDSIHVYPDNA